MKITYKITCSIVCFKNSPKQLKEAVDSFFKTTLPFKLFIIDNSPTDELIDLFMDERILYIHNPSNPGFGKAHNIAIKKAVELNSDYHLILNPDIYFNDNVIENLVKFMDNNPDIGVVMPKVLYPDNRLQRLGKLIPSPIEYIVRRFVPIKFIQEKINHTYELHDYDYLKPMEVPFLSGCFLMARTDVLNKVNGFDENFFMYMEDNDLCRRILKEGYKTMIYPLEYIYHNFERKSFIKNMKVFSRSGIYYFNKWGWFFDRDRNEINTRVLQKLKSL